MGMTHFDDAPSHEFALGHLRGRWTMLGEAAGCRQVGVRRIQLPAGGWSTPAHDHGRGEEIFYVLAGSGLSWQRGRATPIATGDCIVYHPRRGEHTVRGGDGGIDLLAFGPREHDAAPRFPQLGMSVLGGRAVASEGGPPDGTPIQFIREAEHGPPALPDHGDEPVERPSTIVNLTDVEAVRVEHGRVARTRRNLGRRAGSETTGLQHVVVEPGREGTAQHCHSEEEEIFVILEGSGVLVLDDDETRVGPGHVISRLAGTGVAHVFRADGELTYLAYGQREPGDMCWYPRSRKVSLRGLGVMFRVERITDYWDGEE